MDLEVVVEALRYLIFLFSQSLPLTYFFIFNPVTLLSIVKMISDC